MSGLVPDPTPDPNPNPNPDPTPTPDPNPTPAPSGERPEHIPEEAWDAETGTIKPDAIKTILDARRAPDPDVPADAASYDLAAIEGVDDLDLDQVKASPLFQSLAGAAHKAGIGQAEFQGIMAGYIKQETERSQTQLAAEQEKLGSTPEARASRLQAVGQFLDAKVGPDLGKALRDNLRTADAVMAIEKLMGGTPAPRDPPPTPAPTKTQAEIEKLMSSPAYSGRPDQRDPAVVKEVNDWFAAQK